MDMAFHDSCGETARPESTGSAIALRAIGWSDLCARLVAAQDLRRLLSTDQREAGDVPSASFHTPAARMLALGNDADPLVNLMSSANGKGEQRNAAAATGFNALPFEPR